VLPSLSLLSIYSTTATDIHGSGAEDDDNTEKQLKTYRIVMIVFIVLSVVLAVAVAYFYTSSPATAKDGSLIP
jgi:Na+(H+)/acetate symporter ActP